MIKKVFPVLALSIFASMLGIGIIVPLLPLYAENLGATGIWLGVIFAGFSIARTITTPIAGRLSDRRGRKLLLSIGLLSSAIISLGYMAESLWGLTLVRLLHGAAAGMIQPVAQAYIGDLSPKGEEGKWMGYFYAAFFAGFGCGPLMGGLNLLAFLIVVFLLPEIGKRKMAAAPLSSFREISGSSTVKGLFSFQLAFSLGRGIFATFLPIFAGIHIGLSPTLIGILVAVNILLMSLLQIYGGNIADRLNRRVLLAVGSLGIAASLALIPLGSNFWQLLGICALGGISGAMSNPAASALGVEEGRRFGMGSTIAILAMAFSLGMGVGPLLGGVIYDFINVNSVFYFGAAVGVIGTALFVWFARLKS